MAFYRKSGKQNVRWIAKASGTAFTTGDAVKTNGSSANVTAATSDAAWLGIAVEDAASASTARTPIDILEPGVWIVGKVEAGTPTNGDWGKCDINTVDGVTLTNANGDFLYQYVGEYDGATYYVDLLPKRLECTEDTA